MQFSLIVNRFSFLLSLFVFLLLSACTEKEAFQPADQLAPEGLSAPSGSSVEAMMTVSLTPSGDASGVTDADAIEAALAGLSAGDVLSLAAGTFYLNRTVSAPVGFNGSLRGAGVDATEIIPVGDDGTPYGNGLIASSGVPFPVPSSALFYFPDPEGSLTVSHFSASVPDGFATEIGFYGNRSLDNFLIVGFENNEADTHFSDLRLTGNDEHPDTPGSFLGSQPGWGIQVLGNGFSFPDMVTGGSHEISDCEISQVGIQVTLHQLFKGAGIKVSDNDLFDVKQTIYRYLDGCAVEVTRNDIDASSLGSIVVTQEFAPINGASNAVHIHRNRVTTAGFMPIEIGSTSNGSADFNLLIEKNKLANNGPDPLGIFFNLTGIGLFAGNDNAVVSNNIIRGEAAFAILSESNGSTFQANNTEGMNALEADYLIAGNGNTVLGTGTGTVLEFGSDNIITGLQGVAGESIGDRLEAARATRRQIRDAIRDGY